MRKKDKAAERQPSPPPATRARVADGGVDQWPASTGQVWNGTTSHEEKAGRGKDNQLRLDHLPEPSGFASPTSPASLTSPLSSLPTPTTSDWALCGVDSGEADYGMWRAPEEESAFSYSHPSEADSWNVPKESSNSGLDNSTTHTGVTATEAEGQQEHVSIRDSHQAESDSMSASHRSHIGDNVASGCLDDPAASSEPHSVAEAVRECEDTEADQAKSDPESRAVSDRTAQSGDAPEGSPLEAPESEAAVGEAKSEPTPEVSASSHDAPEADTAENDGKGEVQSASSEVKEE